MLGWWCGGGGVDQTSYCVTPTWAEGGLDWVEVGLDVGLSQ